MTFHRYLSLLIEYTESRALVLSRQSEAFAFFIVDRSIPDCAHFLNALGMPAK